MALTAQEEALVRQLLDEQAAILSLAGSEATILSKLGATKVTLSDLTAVSTVADADLLLMRQGTTDKSMSALIFGAYAANAVPAASETVAGKVEIATDAEVQTGTDTVRTVTPAGLSARTATVTRTGVVELATSSEVQTGTDTARAVTPAGLSASVQGFNQTPTDVTASRAFATTYTNNTGRPIQVTVRVLQNSGASSSQAALTVNGVVVNWSTQLEANFLVTSAITYSIPNNATYSVSVINGAMLLSSWIEYR